jgi:hypothetical protein
MVRSGKIKRAFGAHCITKASCGFTTWETMTVFALSGMDIGCARSLAAADKTRRIGVTVIAWAVPKSSTLKTERARGDHSASKTS